MSGEQRELTFRFLAEPTDVNYGGKVHGSVVMKWIDQVGDAAAVGWSGQYGVTVPVRGIRFVAPICISDLVTVTATLVHTGTTSMHFAIDVRARDPGLDSSHATERLCTHCIIVFVALDGVEGKPVSVPAWQPRDEDDQRLAEYALQVMALGEGHRTDRGPVAANGHEKGRGSGGLVRLDTRRTTLRRGAPAGTCCSSSR